VDRYKELLSFEHRDGQKTDFFLDTFLDPDGVQAPVFLVRESPDNQGPPLDGTVLGGIARGVAGEADLSAQEMRLFTQTPDGTFTQHDLGEVNRSVRSMEADVPFHEQADFQQAVAPQEETFFYSQKETQVPAEQVQAQVGPEHSLDYPKSHEEGLQEALRQDSMPTIERGSLDPSELSAMEQQVETQRQEQAMTPQF